MKKKKKLTPYPELIKKHDKDLMKSCKKFTKSIKRIKKACDKYDDPKRKAEFLYYMGILNEYDWHVIRNGIIMYEEERLKRNLERVNRNCIYGLCSRNGGYVDTNTVSNSSIPVTGMNPSTTNAGSNTFRSIVEDIDENSMYPTRMINVEMPKPMTGYMAKACDNPTVVKSRTVVKVRKREL